MSNAPRPEQCGPRGKDIRRKVALSDHVRTKFCRFRLSGECPSLTSISVAKGHVWTAPSWQELSSRLQHWSVQPCVRPLDAVHMTAGHNALRGSGPGQKHAFDNAVAQVGCPDRRIDRLCITCCSPSQPSHHADDRRDLVTPQARRVLCSARPWPSSPRPSWRACWRAQSRQPSSGAWPTMM